MERNRNDSGENDDHPPPPAGETDGFCLLCENSLGNARYPRHRVILEDESENAPNRRKESRLCSECWTNFYNKLSHNFE